jgi:hypothetical protein
MRRPESWSRVSCSGNAWQPTAARGLQIPSLLLDCTSFAYSLPSLPVFATRGKIARINDITRNASVKHFTLASFQFSARIGGSLGRRYPLALPR